MAFSLVRITRAEEPIDSQPIEVALEIRLLPRHSTPARPTHISLRQQAGHAIRREWRVAGAAAMKGKHTEYVGGG